MAEITTEDFRVTSLIIEKALEMYNTVMNGSAEQIREQAIQMAELVDKNESIITNRLAILFKDAWVDSKTFTVNDRKEP